MVSKQDVWPVQLTPNNELIVVEVNYFKYLGSLMNKSLDPDEEIEIPIQMARSAFMILKAILYNPQLNL